MSKTFVLFTSVSGCRALLLGAWLLLLAPTAWSAEPGSTPGADESLARGVLRAQNEALLSSALSERIVSMPFREGEHFRKGEVLVGFDCGRLTAEMRAARAGAAVEARNATVQDQLLRMAATGQADADIAHYKQQERQAQAEVIQEQMKGCQIVAPYSGRVVEALARVNETPTPNEKLLNIVSDGQLELYMIVPSKWLDWLKNGSELQLTVDETGDVLPARVERISAAVDAVSQTVKIVAQVEHSPASVLPGMSGQVTLTGNRPPTAER
ncbi:efflux RND transporter periplasmic adaptor subunit [Pseudomonas sp. NFXW11]|uniref:efflux RND transporter periplasmic adaptor subunit n=1 Tax=Pseudomonas sp. NFXW11 TaxID=2819531 RepID=UPI003CED9635